MFHGRLFIGLLLLAVPTLASADPFSLSSKSRNDLLNAQIRMLDNRAASQYSFSIRLKPTQVYIPGTPQALAEMDARDSPYFAPAQSAAEAHDIPLKLFLALVQQESGWNPNAVSPKGAIGLAQLMPQTARLLKVDPRNPSENLMGGARYLRQMYDKFGTWRLALAAYNAGPEAVEKYRGVPPYTETRNYVQAILTYQ